MMLRAEENDRSLILTLDRPEKRNSLPLKERRERIAEEYRRLEANVNSLRQR